LIADSDGFKRIAGSPTPHLPIVLTGSFRSCSGTCSLCFPCLISSPRRARRAICFPAQYLALQKFPVQFLAFPNFPAQLAGHEFDVRGRNAPVG
jgi:hypothetical protein